VNRIGVIHLNVLEVLPCFVVCCKVLQGVARCRHSELHWRHSFECCGGVAMCCSGLQCVAVCCKVLHDVMTANRIGVILLNVVEVLQCIARYCNVL